MVEKEQGKQKPKTINEFLQQLSDLADGDKTLQNEANTQRLEVLMELRHANKKLKEIEEKLDKQTKALKALATASSVEALAINAIGAQLSTQTGLLTKIVAELNASAPQGEATELVMKLGTAVPQ